jgi:mono/diheme cytochrome c family protein
MQLRKRFVRLACGAAFAECAFLFLAGCHTQPQLTPEQAAGKQVYDVGCAHCHEQNDLHLKKVPPDLHGLFSRSTLPDGEPATDSEVEQVIVAGKGMMPAFGYQITKPQLESLLAYLHTALRDQKRQLDE